MACSLTRKERATSSTVCPPSGLDASVPHGREAWQHLVHNDPVGLGRSPIGVDPVAGSARYLHCGSAVRLRFVGVGVAPRAPTVFSCSASLA